MGYLNAPTSKESKVSRITQLDRDGVVPDMPDAPAYLIEWMGKLGWCAVGMNGPMGLSASEIRAWAQGCKKDLLAWEFEALLNASRQYVSGYYTEENLGADKVVSFSAFAKNAGKAKK